MFVSSWWPVPQTSQLSTAARAAASASGPEGNAGPGKSGEEGVGAPLPGQPAWLALGLLAGSEEGRALEAAGTVLRQALDLQAVQQRRVPFDTAAGADVSRVGSKRREGIGAAASVFEVGAEELSAWLSEALVG
ncbi:hypothetical protein HaLaN_32484, partial [Haematococcus lacustris]